MVQFRGKLKFRTTKFTELTDSQWKVIKEIVDNGRKRKYCLRNITNAILKVVRTGVQWRNIDEKYPPWESVYYYFRKFQKNETWSIILRKLVELERVRVGRNPMPSRIAVDSQSVKIGSFICIETGIDGNKKVNGRKRHIAVDCLGLPMALHVSAANRHDGTEGRELLWQLEGVERLETIAADGTYKGQFEEDADWYNWRVEITQKPPSEKGFIPQSARWQVERSFGWFNFFRRLSRDFEKTTESSVSFMQLAFITIILARLEN